MPVYREPAWAAMEGTPTWLDLVWGTLASLCSVLISKICDHWETPLGPSELVHSLGMEGCGASGPFCYSQDPTWHLLLCLLLGGSVAQEA